MRTLDTYVTQQTARYMRHRDHNLAAAEAVGLPAWAREAHGRMAAHAETRLAMLADYAIQARACFLRAASN